MIRRGGLAMAGAATAAFALVCCTNHTIIQRVEPEGDGGSVEEPFEDGGSGEEASCPAVGATTVAGKVDSPDVEETSGIVASAVNDGAYWVHNDSGDTARAFAIDPKGKYLATLTFDSVKPADIEDMAIEDVSPGKSFLYFGDIGDNAEARANLTIHRVAEPKLGSGSALSATSETMSVVYSDGAHNAETLLFDPVTKDLLIATKRAGGPSAIHRIGAFAAGTTAKTQKIASVDVDTATGGDISRDGRLIAIRDYTKRASVWVREPGESLADALARKPCMLPVAAEAQGEAFAFLLETKGYVTLSEGAFAELHVTPFE